MNSDLLGNAETALLESIVSDPQASERIFIGTRDSFTKPNDQKKSFVFFLTWANKAALIYYLSALCTGHKWNFL